MKIGAPPIYSQSRRRKCRVVSNGDGAAAGEGRRRRRSSNAIRACSHGGGGGGGGGGSSGSGGGETDALWSAAMSDLKRRISKTKEAAVAADKLTATNWRSANFKMAYLGQSSRKGGAVMALEVRDGMVATATAVGEVCVQALPAGQIVAQLGAPDGVAGELTAMDFDGSHVVAGFASGEIAAWDIGPMIITPASSSIGGGDVDAEDVASVRRSDADSVGSHDGEDDADAIEAVNHGGGGHCKPLFVGVHSDVPVTGVRICDSVGATFFPSFVSSSADGLVRCWDGLEDGHGLGVRQSAKGPVCCVNTIGDYVIAGTMTGHVQIWPSFGRSGTGGSTREEPIMSFRAHDAQITALQHFCGNGASNETLITGGADGLVKVWDMQRGGQPVHQFKGHDDGITSVQSDSAKVVTAGLDNTVRGTFYTDTHTPEHNTQLSWW